MGGPTETLDRRRVLIGLLFALGELYERCACAIRGGIGKKVGGGGGCRNEINTNEAREASKKRNLTGAKVRNRQDGGN